MKALPPASSAVGGAIGYVEYGFAKHLGLPMAYLENKAGRFVEPAPESGQAAIAANVDLIPGNLRVFLPTRKARMPTRL